MDGPPFQAPPEPDNRSGEDRGGPGVSKWPALRDRPSGPADPQEVRTYEFDARRRGVDPDQVREFQLCLAEELTALHNELALVVKENERLKRALRDWQSMHARTCRQPGQAFPDNLGRR